ncbi:hypothetical protein AVEN_70507-1 [Araneus ventricosus]|uniref:Uncharacterized protein n=1 Tax=Araneus ventricosus TaxID=182803 RepID=A0A4Y2W6F5_ARAVE|nr:hypothetical protein AVEN_70507-1 [Araneus ventricosus]
MHETLRVEVGFLTSRLLVFRLPWTPPLHIVTLAFGVVPQAPGLVTHDDGFRKFGSRSAMSMRSPQVSGRGCICSGVKVWGTSR